MAEKDIATVVTIGFFILLGILLVFAFVIFGKNKYCPECGARYFNNAVYCTGDGSALKEIN